MSVISNKPTMHRSTGPSMIMWLPVTFLTSKQATEWTVDTY